MGPRRRVVRGHVRAGIDACVHVDVEIGIAARVDVTATEQVGGKREEEHPDTDHESEPVEHVHRLFRSGFRS